MSRGDTSENAVSADVPEVGSPLLGPEVMPRSLEEAAQRIAAPAAGKLEELLTASNPTQGALDAPRGVVCTRQNPAGSIGLATSEKVKAKREERLGHTASGRQENPKASALYIKHCAQLGPWLDTIRHAFDTHACSYHQLGIQQQMTRPTASIGKPQMC